MQDSLLRAGTYVIPHHAVYRQDATKTKCRVVFNASSTIKGKMSLNQCLSKGASINSDLWTVLSRFRIAPIVLMTDLVKAFLQIRIHPEDRDLLRYLWFNSEKDEQPEMYRMTSVAFGVTSSPALLGIVLLTHANRCEEKFPQVAKQIRSSVYMDDALFVANDIDEARSLVTQAEEFFRLASFELHPWISNERADHFANSQFADNKEVQKCLGLYWHPNNDIVQLKPIDKTKVEFTCRGAVSILSKLFDPLSWFAPIKTSLRLFIRDLACEKMNWNRILTPLEINKLQEILEKLEKVTSKKIPRTKFIGKDGQLHVFCDASLQAYGAVAYLVNPDNNQTIMLGARVKLAPKQFHLTSKKRGPHLTIPRLELMAALVGARLAQALIRILPDKTPIILYSDSSVTLQRIKRNPNQYEAFEMNRLQQILEITNQNQWHHVPSAQNPADLLTKDSPIQMWLDSELWWYGPSPYQYQLAEPVREYHSACMVTQVQPLSEEAKHILKLTWNEAIQELMNKLDLEMLAKINFGKQRNLRPQEYVKTQIFGFIQKDLFDEDLNRINSRLLVKSNSSLKLLRPFLDEWGLMRNRRLAQPAELNWEQCNPIILGSHPLVRDLVRAEHARLGHSGTRELRNHLHNYYHIIRGRRLIRSVISSCKQCNVQRGKSFVPEEPILPAFRAEIATNPFECIGLDYLGPLKMKRSNKIYVLLATCSVSRMIHLEMVNSLNVRQCVNALIRMFSRRGIPRRIYSDNGRTFVGVNRSLQKLVKILHDESKNPQSRLPESIIWSFQVPKAPWFGGFWERIVKVVKSRIQHTELRMVTSLDDVNTILCTVEAMLNSRPLVDAEIEGMEALTPAHFIVGKSLLMISPLPSLSEDTKEDVLLNQYLKITKARKTFCERLVQDYILELRRHHLAQNTTREPKINEAVLVKGENIASRDRQEWPIAHIRQLIPGADGVIRTARITMNGRSYIRPVKNLIPLEGISSSSPPSEDVATHSLRL